MKTPNATEATIARNAAELIPDNATLELGIGTLPDTLSSHLKNHKGLSIHSGTVGDGIVGLDVEVDCAMLIGTRKLFDHARGNPKIRLRSSEYTHDPRVLAGIECFVAVNSAVEIDLTGQINGEVANGSYVGAVGGALDFVRAASQSEGGVSLTLLPAGRIVERLSGPVATPRSEAGIVVTEHGSADLRGCSLRERERRLQKIKG
jgi:acyl-CoA hydrolase